MQKTLIILGIAIVIIGLSWPILSKLPLGRLPGDILIKKPIVIYIPITSMLLVSILLSAILFFFRK